jgi:hypothetical protein
VTSKPVTYFSLSKMINPRPGWYRGDFHVHTNASDGDYPPSLVVELARAEGLDFVAITDHNTIEPFSELSKSPDFLVVPGVEITLDGGHLNIFGVANWHDWMEDICVGQIRVSLMGRYPTTTGLMRRTSMEGLLNSINHPTLQPWEWRDGATDLRYVHCLEIWNAPYYPSNVYANPQAVALWTAWLNAGYRITAIGGSDYHHPPRPKEGKPGQRLGLPSTYVYAEELSVVAILEGLRQRRAYVSIGPQVAFQAQADEIVYGIGADLGEQSGEIEFIAIVLPDGPRTARAQIVKNGEVIAETLIQGGQGSLQCGAAAEPACSDWYRLDVFDQNGQMLAITNPIFVGPRRIPCLHKYGDLVTS